jgi:membrane protein YdbS with pleckstrin-like domain
MNCGAPLNPQARFCPECGAVADTEATRVAPPETTRVATRAPQPPPSHPQSYAHAPNVPVRGGAGRGSSGVPEETEKVIFVVRPTLLFVKIGYALAALCGILLVALISWLAPTLLPLYILIPIALALLLVPAYYHLKRQMVRYTLTDSKIEIDRGFVSRTTRNLPLRNIQDVTVTTSILQRLLGFGDVIIDNASELGGSTVLDDIPDPRRHADILLRELRRWH